MGAPQHDPPPTPPGSQLKPGQHFDVRQPATAPEFPDIDDHSPPNPFTEPRHLFGGDGAAGQDEHREFLGVHVR